MIILSWCFIIYSFLSCLFYQNDENGNQLKNIIIDKGLVQQAVQYLELYTPSQSFRYVTSCIQKRYCRLMVGYINKLSDSVVMFSDAVYFFFFSTSNLGDTDLWKEFLARPSLPFILKFLSGMCKGHERSQVIRQFLRTRTDWKIVVLISSHVYHG